MNKTGKIPAVKNAYLVAGGNGRTDNKKINNK